MIQSSRRDWLKLISLAAAATTVPGCWTNHRRLGKVNLQYGLFFDAQDLVGIRAQWRDNDLFAALRAELAALDRDALRTFMRTEVQIDDPLIDGARLEKAAQAAAFLWVVEEDEDAALLAEEVIDTYMRFPKWDFFMEETGQTLGVQRAPATSIAVVLVADWLGDRIEASKRAQWFTALKERGCAANFASLKAIRNPNDAADWSFDPETSILRLRPGNETDLSRRPAITQETNLRAIPAGALMISTLALEAEEGISPTTRRWFEMALDAMKAFAQIYEPDGSYNEGVSYANYTSTHLVQAMDVLLRRGGVDIRSHINWPGYARYCAEMSMATKADPYWIVNFGDNGNPRSGLVGSVKRSATPFWIAKQFQDPVAAWVGLHVAGGCDLWSLLWYDASVRPAVPDMDPHLWVSDLDWVVARTGYGADDLVVALRSGRPANHEHADRNAIVIKDAGEQLITDPYRPPYSFSDPNWASRLTQGHSAILIDGKGHEHHNGVEGTNASYAHAKVIYESSSARHAYVVSDASQAYRHVDLEIRYVIRTVLVLFDERITLVIDHLAKRMNPSRMTARFMLDNYDDRLRYDTGLNTFSVDRPNARLRASCWCSHPFTITAGQLPLTPDFASRHPFVDVQTVPSETPIWLATLIQTGTSPVAPGEKENVPAQLNVSGDVIQLHTGDQSLATITLRGRRPELVLS